MMNYIWGGLIVVSLIFALVVDVRDLNRDTYRNDQPLAVSLEFPSGYDAEMRRVPVTVALNPAMFQQFYGVNVTPAASYTGHLIQTADGTQLRFADGVGLPEPLHTIRDFTNTRSEDLPGVLTGLQVVGDSAATAMVTFGAVRFLKMNAIAAAAIDFAEIAVTIALGLIGVLALWLGLMRIAEKAGLIEVLVRFIQPVFRPLFPGIPKGHPAMGMIALNMTANVLGLGNAATPMGIKAMEELQTLNPEKDTATNDMAMFLAINTSSVQLIPPATLVAVMGLQINQLFFAIILATLVSTAVGILAVKLLQRLPKHRATDPHRA